MNVVCNKPSFTINLNGDVVALTPPLVMGILNVTPIRFMPEVVVIPKLL